MQVATGVDIVAELAINLLHALNQHAERLGIMDAHRLAAFGFIVAAVVISNFGCAVDGTKIDETANEISAASPGCWVFVFKQIGHVFPNPADTNTTRKVRLNLLVLGTDTNLNPATISVVITNISGATVATRDLGSFPSLPSFDVAFWSGLNVASGVYFVTVSASSAVCGSSSFTDKFVVVN